MFVYLLRTYLSKFNTYMFLSWMPLSELYKIEMVPHETTSIQLKKELL